MTSSPLVLAGGVLPTLSPPNSATSDAADTVVVQQGRIAAIGRWRDLRADLPADATVLDVAGGVILPGLGDAHAHVAATGYLETALDCHAIPKLEALLEHIAARAAQTPRGQLLLGLRLDDFADGARPSRAQLDAAAPHHPVYLRHITGHASYANSRALELLDFAREQPGLERDQDGLPSGFLRAQATQLATQRMYAHYAATLGYAQAFEAAAARAARNGCTVVHAMDDLEAVQALLPLEAKLPVRIVPYAQTFDLPAVRRLGLPRIGGCHGCALDGDFDMHTAALLEPYADRPGERGCLYHDDASVHGFVLAAHRRGLQVAFHAVGDRAVEQALEAFEAAQRAHPRPDPRHRIEHAQLIQPEQVARAKRLGVVLSIQPAFNHHWDHTTYRGWLGARAAAIDPLASLQRSGVALAGGSDSTVTELAPLIGIHAAVNHSRPEERLGVAEAVALFTEGVAYATFDEARRGRLALGYDADLTILAESPFDSDPRRIAEITVQLTVARGRIVYRA